MDNVDDGMSKECMFGDVPCEDIGNGCKGLEIPIDSLMTSSCQRHFESYEQTTFGRLGKGRRRC